MGISLPPPGTSPLPMDNGGILPNPGVTNPPATDTTSGALPPITDTVTSTATVTVTGNTITVSTDGAAPLPIIVSGQLVDFSNPVLPSGGDYSSLDTLAETNGNAWLDTAVQVTLSLILLETAKMQAEGQMKEALLSRDQMIGLFALGMEAADLIMEKAEKEKEQYMALAIAGFASMAMAVAGAATSIAGARSQYKATSAKNEAKRLDNLADKAVDDVPMAGSDPTKMKTAAQKKETYKKAAETYRQESAEYTLDASRFSSIGQMQTHSASSLSSVLQNSIQASYVLEIADYDRQKTIVESMEKVTQHAQDAATQAARDLGDAVQQLLQLARSYSDSSAQNFSIGRG